MQTSKYFTNAVFSISLLVSLSAFADELPVVEQVLGEKPLSTFTHVVVDSVGAVKDGVVSLGQNLFDGVGDFILIHYCFYIFFF